MGRAASLIAEDDPRRAELLWEYGTVLNRVGANAAAMRVLAQASELAAATGDEVLAARAHIDGFFARMFFEDVRDAIREEIEPMLPHLLERSDDLGSTKALQVMAYDRSRYGLYEEEVALLEQALRHARLAGDRLEEAEILTSLLDSLWQGPTPVDALLGRCDEIARDPRKDRRTDSRVLATRALLMAMRGRFEEARALSSEAEAIQRDLGLEYGAFESATRAFTVEWLAGDPVAAERELLRPEHELSPEDPLTWHSARDALLVRSLCAQGRFEEARALTEREELSGELTWATVLWMTGRAKVRAAAGDHGEAERLARDAVEIAAKVQSPGMRGDALMDLAWVLASRDHVEESIAAATEAKALYERKGDVVSSRRAQTFIDDRSP